MPIPKSPYERLLEKLDERAGDLPCAIAARTIREQALAIEEQGRIAALLAAGLGVTGERVELADLVRPVECLRLDLALLRATLEDARDNGLVYWEPNTERGTKRKDAMLARIEKVLEGKR